MVRRDIRDASLFGENGGGERWGCRPNDMTAISGLLARTVSPAERKFANPR
jgi:hypothetical protein